MFPGRTGTLRIKAGPLHQLGLKPVPEPRLGGSLADSGLDPAGLEKESLKSREEERREGKMGRSLGVLMLGLASACLLWEGAQCLLRNYWLTAPPAVSVPLGLCVIIPCNFTYEQRHADRDAPLYGYWFEAESVYTGAPVATNNPRKTVQSYTRNRFTLSEHLDQGDCSLTIKNARKTDRKQYIFRVEREPRAKFTYSFYAVPYVNVTDPPQTPQFSGELIRANRNLQNFSGVTQISAQRGDSVVLRCEVEGNPVPSVTWVRGPQPPQTLQLVSSENELKLSSLTQQHEGKYECRAQNSEGSSKATFLLSTTGK
ncbi:Sialic acid-binding Ig-like lectin 10 [Varanus komodoensis]|nr:Sialic acid-binding Ig-like lectin 10 [Varanus komodoensis]